MNHGSETDLGVLSNAKSKCDQTKLYSSKTYLPCMSEKAYLKYVFAG